MLDLRTTIENYMELNLVSVDELRSLAGRANHVATLVYTWRPFLDQLWAAVAGTKPSNAPAGKVWIKSVLASLTWLLIFLTDEPGHLVREWRTDVYAQPGAKAVMQLDASVYGFGVFSL